MNDAGFEAFVRERLPVAPAPGVPEIRLHLAGPASRLGALDGAPPYWAHCWGGGIALARHILDHPAAVAGKQVLDLGCGGGVVGIAAALASATVAVEDSDPRAPVVAGLNAALNGVEFTAIPAPDLILAGDVFYDAEAASLSIAALDRWAVAGVPALVGDPWRKTLPIQRLRLVAEYPVVDFGGTTLRAGVFDWV